MNLVCRFGWHRWRYHGDPAERRRCFLCDVHQWLDDGAWVTR